MPFLYGQGSSGAAVVPGPPPVVSGNRNILVPDDTIANGLINLNIGDTVRISNSALSGNAPAWFAIASAGSFSSVSKVPLPTTDGSAAPWLAGRNYGLHAVATQNGDIIVRGAPGLARPTYDATEAAQWTRYRSERGARPWTAATYYDALDFATFGKALLIRKTSGMSAGTYLADAANWDVFGPAGALPWTMLTDYNEGDLAWINGKVRRRNSDGTSRSAYDVTEAALWTDADSKFAIITTIAQLGTIPAPSATGTGGLVVLEEQVAGDRTNGFYLPTVVAPGVYAWDKSGANDPRRVVVLDQINGFAPVPSLNGAVMMVVLRPLVANDGTEGLYMPLEVSPGLYAWQRSGATDPTRVWVQETIFSASIPTPQVKGYALMVVLKDASSGDGTAGVYKPVQIGASYGWDRVSEPTQRVAVVNAYAAAPPPSPTSWNLLVVLTDPNPALIGLHHAEQIAPGVWAWTKNL